VKEYIIPLTSRCSTYMRLVVKGFAPGDRNPVSAVAFILSDKLLAYMMLTKQHVRCELKFAKGVHFNITHPNPDPRDSIHLAYHRPSGVELQQLDLQPQWTEDELVAYISARMIERNRAYATQDGVTYAGPK
jgi:hypothetical protein